MPNITIDGRTLEVPAGKTVLQAALDAGIEVPSFCYHPGLSIAGNCRICLVKVNGGAKPQIACNTVVAEGMKVETNTPDVIQARAGVMEFQLLNHPLDCPVCDKAGECILQNHSYDHGPDQSRLVDPKVVKPKKDLGPTIKLWEQRCIKCSRCTRFFDEVTGTGELTFTERGDHTGLDIFPGRPVDNPMSLNVVDLCPVGALISKDFLFQARVWFMNTTDSVCGTCAHGCNVHVDTLKDDVRRLRPRHNEAVNGWWMCDLGRVDYHWLKRPDRIREPLRREDARVFHLPHRQALELVKLNLEHARTKWGSRSVAALGSAAMTVEELFLLRRLFVEVLGTEHVAFLAAPDGEPWTSKSGFRISADRNPNRAGVAAVFGATPSAEGVRELAERIESGEVKALCLFSGLPRLEPPEELLAVLSRLDFLAVWDLIEGPLSAKAHLALPSASGFEKDGTWINETGRIQRVRPAVPPLPGAEKEALLHLLRAFGDQPPADAPRALFEACSAVVPALRAIRFTDLGQLGLALPEPETAGVQE
jgi:NADH-quinone oxidoreductase subunit G